MSVVGALWHVVGLAIVGGVLAMLTVKLWAVDNQADWGTSDFIVFYMIMAIYVAIPQALSHYGKAGELDE